MFKAAAVGNRLDPSRFSTSSARRFAASNKALSMAEIKKRWGWNESSTVPESHYRRDGESKGAFAVAGGEFSHQQLLALAVKPLASHLDYDDSSDDDEEVGDQYDFGGAEDEEGAGDMLDNLVRSLAAAAQQLGSPVKSPPPEPAAKKRTLPVSISGPKGGSGGASAPASKRSKQGKAAKAV
jgi:hypothetical protein